MTETVSSTVVEVKGLYRDTVIAPKEWIVKNTCFTSTAFYLRTVKIGRALERIQRRLAELLHQVPKESFGMVVMGQNDQYRRKGRLKS